jgi:hypothetical protein
MPINRLLENEAFGPEDIEVLVKAFEDTLSALGVLRRDDLLAELVAKKIIESARTGERDPIRLRDCALNLLAAN